MGFQQKSFVVVLRGHLWFHMKQLPVGVPRKVEQIDGFLGRPRIIRLTSAQLRDYRVESPSISGAQFAGLWGLGPACPEIGRGREGCDLS